MRPNRGRSLSESRVTLTRYRRSSMHVYVIIDTERMLGPRIKSLFKDADTCRVSDEMWFVRSAKLSSSEIVSDLEIATDPGSPTGIVVSARGYDGVADRRIVEKLGAWERGL